MYSSLSWQMSENPSFQSFRGISVSLFSVFLPEIAFLANYIIWRLPGVHTRSKRCVVILDVFVKLKRTINRDKTLGSSELIF